MRELRINLFIVTVILLAIGLVMVYSSSAIYAYETYGDSGYFIKRQMLFLFLGCLFAFFFMSLPLDSIRRLSKPFIAACILLLVAVLLFGSEVGGAKRWFRAFGLGFQPSELTKLALIIYLADALARKQQYIGNFFYGIMPPVLVSAFIVGLVLLEPDLGTAVCMSLVVMILFFVAGVNARFLAGAVCFAIPVLYFLIFHIPYRRRRILAFLNPWQDMRGSGYQIVQSFLALGSGGIFGVGLGNSIQKLYYLPGSHTDFIFSIIGEELGLLGIGVLICLYITFLLYGAKIVSASSDTFGRFLAMGICSLIGLEAIINIAVCSGALPTKGLPLPFVSYGGSSLIFHTAMVGLLLNVCKSS